MTRARRRTLQVITAVIPQSQRDCDRGELEYFAGLLDSRLPIGSERHEFARILRRYLADDYPAKKVGQPKKALRHRAIAEAYVWMHDYQGDELTSNKIASHCRQHGVDIQAQSVGRIARALREEAQEYVTACLTRNWKTYTREAIIQAHLDDALRRAVEL